MIKIETAIYRGVANAKTKRWTLLAQNVESLTFTKETTQCSSPGCHRGEKALLIEGVNLIVEDASKRKYVTELEHTLKITGISDETKQKIRHSVVRTLTRRTNESDLLTRRKRRTGYNYSPGRQEISHRYHRQSRVYRKSTNIATRYVDLPSNQRLSNPRVCDQYQRLQELHQISRVECWRIKVSFYNCFESRKYLMHKRR